MTYLRHIVRSMVLNWNEAVRSKGRSLTWRITSSGRCVLPLAAGAAFLILGFVGGCESEQPGEQTEYRTDMYYQPSFKPQEDPIRRVAGTVPMSGYEPPIKDSSSATRLKNPFIFTRASEDTAKFLFNTYCSVCHGVGAKGDGLVAPKFQTPPDLTVPLYRKTPDGYFYFIARNGHLIMPSYYEHTTQRERWLIVAHLRRLQER